MLNQFILENFGVIAGAPDGIGKLRAMVLNLAFTGKLASSDASDSSVDDFVLDLQQSRNTMIAEGTISKPRYHDPVAVQDPPFPIPSHWAWVRLGDIGTIVGGGTPKSNDPSCWADGHGIPWLTPADMRGQASHHVTRGNRDITAKGLASSSAQLLPAESVLFSSRAPIGHVAIAAAALTTNQGFKSCVPYDPRMSAYIYTFLLSAGPRIDAAASGTTFKEVSGKEMSMVEFPLPPIEEQERIVAMVDELFAHCDVLEDRRREQNVSAIRARKSLFGELSGIETRDDVTVSWGRVDANWEILTDHPDAMLGMRGSILDLAVRGQLVPPARDGKSAETEMQSVFERKRELKLRKPKAVKPVTADEKWFATPEGWVWARWEDITDWITYGFTRPMPHVETGIPIITGKNVRFGAIQWQETHKTTDEAFEQLSDKDRPVPGDLLVTKDGSIGRSAIVEDDIKFCINQSVAVLWLRSCDFDRRFLQLVIQSPHVQSELIRKTEGVALKHVSVVDFGRIPIPPIAIQRQIVAKVGELMAICDDLERALTDQNDCADSVGSALCMRFE
jgi:type I restriction enzyme S subunit